MPCKLYPVGDKGYIVICTPRSSLPDCAQCKANKVENDVRCQYPLRGEKAGQVCGRPLCKHCAQTGPDGKVYCRPHRRILK